MSLSRKNSFFSLAQFIIVAYCLFPIASFGQKEKQFIHEGNKQYDIKKYSEAEKNYNQALTKNKDSYKSIFNLGDAYYKQNKFEEAAEQFQILTHKATSKDTLSKAYHNLGNSLLKAKKYQESIDAYKNALKNNPNDEDTRYNLSYAQQMLKQQQQQQKQDKDNKDKKDNKDQKKEDKKEQEKKDNKDKKEQEKQEEPENKISKEDAKRLLDALQNDEKNLHDKMKKKQIKGVKGQIEKDW